MDSTLIYAKTPIGDEAVRQSTRVVQRNLRMVLVQVDGKMSVEELGAKIGNPRLVQNALRELEAGGFIAPTVEAVSVWEASRKTAQLESQQQAVSAMSGFTTFAPRSIADADDGQSVQSAISHFSSFGKPILPADDGMPTGHAASRDPQARHDEANRRLDPRGRWSFGRILFFAAGMLLLGAVALALFFPYERLKEPIESALGRTFGVPVQVGGIGLGLIPAPHLKISDVRLAGGGAVQVAEIRLGSPLALLGGAPYRIGRVDAISVSLGTDLLASMPVFRGAPLSEGEFAVERLHVEQARLSLADGFPLPVLSGDVRFAADGTIDRANFENEDRGLLIQAIPGRQGIALAIDGRSWQPAGSEQLSFTSLQAKGLLSPGRLTIQNIDTNFMGGILRGAWAIDWRSSPTMSGEGSLSRIDIHKLGAALAPLLKMEGDLSGSLRLGSAGANWESLWRNAEGTMNAEIARGVFHGIDLGEATRRSGDGETRGGTTRFDRLRLNLAVAPAQLVGRDLRLEAGMMTATGQFVASPGGQIDGSLAVVLRNSVSSVSAPLRIQGQLPDLVATGRK